MENNKDQFALPQVYVSDGQGLTKREYFAGLALQGMMANRWWVSTDRTRVVKIAIEHADELLKQLEK